MERDTKCQFTSRQSSERQTRLAKDEREFSTTKHIGSVACLVSLYQPFPSQLKCVCWVTYNPKKGFMKKSSSPHQKSRMDTLSNILKTENSLG